MAKPSTKGLLREILSDDIEWVYVHISNKAVEWAIAGFVDEANSLLEKLWDFKIPHSENLWLPDEALQVIWELSKKQPSNIPFKFKPINEIEGSCWSGTFYMCGDQASIDRVLSKPIIDLNANDAYHKVIINGLHSSENPKDILEALKRFIDQENPIGSTLAHATLCGALLASKYNKSEFARYFIKLWGEGYLKYWSNYMIADIMRYRKCAKYLLEGILADTFSLTKQKCLQESDEIIKTLAKRMVDGRSLVYGNLSWKQLLNKISELAIKQKTIDFSENTILKNTLLKTATTIAEIAKIEKKLNVLLPDDYKTFLLTSNGFDCFSYTGVTLSPLSKVDFLVKVDQQLVDIWAESMDELDTIFGDKLKTSIIIGGHEEEQQLLLIPLQNNSWECWHFSSWRPGEVMYESFRFYMEGELQSLEDNVHID